MKGARGSRGKPILPAFLMSFLSVKLSATTVDCFLTNLTHCRSMCCVVEWVASDVSKDCGAFEASWSARPVTASYLKRSLSLATLLWGPQTSQLCISVIGCLKTAKMRVFQPVDVHYYLLAIWYWNCVVLDKEYYRYTEGKDKVFPLQAQCGPEGG